MKIGSIVSYHHIKTFESKIQRFFMTIEAWALGVKEDGKYHVWESHASIFADVGKFGRMYESEANLQEDFTPLNLNPEKNVVYEIAGLSEEDANKAIENFEQLHSEDIYDFLSWLFIFFRICFEVLLKPIPKWQAKVKGWEWLGWLQWGHNCTERIWWHLNKSTRYKSEYPMAITWFLDDYIPRVFNHVDLRIMRQKFPELFKRVYP